MKVLLALSLMLSPVVMNASSASAAEPAKTQAKAAAPAQVAAAKKAEAPKSAATKVKAAAKDSAKHPVVEMKTSEGVIKIELYEDKAPVSVKNFLEYVNDKFYDGTVFHRVIDGFMIQGGGYEIKAGKLSEKATKKPIENEAKNGLKNDRGWIAMARTSDPNSATAQFFINLVNNDNLNFPKPDQHGYAVFGKVTTGLDVVEKIGKAKTSVREGMSDVPAKDVIIQSVKIVK